MIKILKNTTASSVSIDVGDTVPANGQLTVNPQDYGEYAASDEIVTLIGNGSIVVNDGSRDLNISEGIRLIQGGFTNKIQFEEDLLSTSDRLKVSVETDSTSIDHGLLIGLDDDDHPQYLTDARGDAKYYTKAQVDLEIDTDVAAHADRTDNPHQVNKGQVGLGSVDNTSDEDKPVSLAQQAALDLKYDASNPNGYETPAQLNTRDTANRDRSNHTGTQDASTITGLPAVVAANETLTSLSFNSGTSVLTYTPESGTPTNIDLSLFLDNTDLTVVSGVLDANTGIATFTRNDNSTFTLDLSSLLDNQDASEVPSNASGNLTATNVQDALVQLTQKDDTLEIEIENIQLEQIAQNAQINNLQNSQSTQDTNISNNASDISAIQTEQTTQDTNISNNASDISNIQTEQTTQNTNIANNQNDISILQSSQTTQDSAIALNTAKVSADGSIGTHSDVDITGVTLGSQLQWNGSQFVPASIDNGFTIFPIWAEEGGGLSNNNRQWSFGNGAVGAINITMAFDCEVFAMTLDAENSGTSVSIDLMRENGAVTTQLFTGASGVANFTAIPYLAGQRLGFRTNTETGVYSDVRVCAWCRVKSTAVFPTPDRSVVSNSNVTFTSTTFTTIPGLSTTVTISDTGTIDGTLIYSAARSGITNSETQFRVTIGGVNGLSFSDTLSTFNDTGGASFFRAGLPAGTYTVIAEAIVSEPILIASCQLTAVGVED
jgi:hypothetical protein